MTKPTETDSIRKLIAETDTITLYNRGDYGIIVCFNDDPVINEFYASGESEINHTVTLPDDQLAKVTVVLLEGLERISKFWPEAEANIARQAIAEAEKIAEGE